MLCLHLHAISPVDLSRVHSEAWPLHLQRPPMARSEMPMTRPMVFCFLLLLLFFKLEEGEEEVEREEDRVGEMTLESSACFRAKKMFM